MLSESIFFHWLYSPLGPWPLIFSFMIILQTVGLLGWVISSSQGLYLNTGQHTYRINTYPYQTFMPCVGFEPKIPASGRAKAVHALDRSATVAGSIYYGGIKIFNNLPSDLKSLMNEKARLKTALKRHLNTHSFYSVDEYLLSKK
jgi:hypothetical protein